MRDDITAKKAAPGTARTKQTQQETLAEQVSLLY
jgi:hypothetical protein